MNFKAAASLRDEIKDGVNCLVFSTSGQFLASGHNERMVIWSVKDSKELYSISTRGRILCITWSTAHENEEIIAGCSDGQLITTNILKVRPHSGVF